MKGGIFMKKSSLIISLVLSEFLFIHFLYLRDFFGVFISIISFLFYFYLLNSNKY